MAVHRPFQKHGPAEARRQTRVLAPRVVCNVLTSRCRCRSCSAFLVKSLMLAPLWMSFSIFFPHTNLWAPGSPLAVTDFFFRWSAMSLACGPHITLWVAGC